MYENFNRTISRRLDIKARRFFAPLFPTYALPSLSYAPYAIRERPVRQAISRLDWIANEGRDAVLRFNGFLWDHGMSFPIKRYMTMNISVLFWEMTFFFLVVKRKCGKRFLFSSCVPSAANEVKLETRY